MDFECSRLWSLVGVKAKICSCEATEGKKKKRLGKKKEGLGMKNKGAQRRRGVEKEEGMGKEGARIRKKMEK